MGESSALKQEGVEDARAVADMYRQQAAYSFSIGGWLSLDKSTFGQYNPDDIQISTYAKMLKDPQVAAALDVIRLAVLANDWNIAYEGEDPFVKEEIIPFLVKELDGINSHMRSRRGMNPVIWEMMTAIAFGFSAAEIVLGRPGDVNDYIHIKKLKVLDPETIARIKTDKHGDIRAVVQSSIGSSNILSKSGEIELHPSKVLLWSYNMEFGNWWGKSDLRRIYTSWFVKHFLLKFWNIATEKFAMPYFVGQAPDDDLDAMLKDIQKLQKRSSIVLGPNKKLDMLKGVVDRGAFLEAIQYHDRKIMTGLLVPSLIIEQEDVGAYAMSKTHFSTFIMRVRSIQNQIEDLFNGLIKLLVDLNFRDIDEYPKFKFDEPDRGDLGSLLSVYSGAVQAGLADPLFDHVWMREKLGFPEADPNSSVVNPPEPMPPEAGGPLPEEGLPPEQAPPPPPMGGDGRVPPSSMPMPAPTTGTGEANAIKSYLESSADIVDYAYKQLKSRVPREVLA
jgi:phage gp29-like protein